MNKIGDIKNKNILFLQGPMGNFFKQVDQKFRKQGANTYKIALNAGDYFYSNKDNLTSFRGKPEGWQDFLHAFIVKYKIDMIFLFGDCRFYQQKAIKLSLKLDLETYVFEEGYIRPHYITLEKFGVNDYSHLSRKRKFYDNLNLDELTELSVKAANYSQARMIFSAIIYYAFSNLFFFIYPYYKHHRSFSALNEAFIGVRSLFRKWYYKWSERNYQSFIIETLSNNYYFIPLQTHNDFQILEHSGYRSIEKFIIEVLESFAQHAPKERWLVLKHHPVDRGRKNYHNFIMRQAELLDVDQRVLIVHDVHLPTCLKHAIATITINSTVGLSSIYHKTPTITLGNAIYDIEGITCKETSLDKFWKQQYAPDMILFEKFQRYLIHNTQLNGSFYGRFPDELKGTQRAPLK